MTQRAERCHRCLQEVPYHTRRCPHCGAPQNVNPRRLAIYASIAGIAAILGIVGFSLYLKPATVNLDNIPESERKEHQDPPKPVKKPPLEPPPPQTPRQ